MFDTQVFLEVLLKGVGFPGTDSNVGEVSSPLPTTVGSDTGELRLQSDSALARDERTACAWQGFVNQQELMASSFKAAMAKLAILGHNRADLIDCSAVVPVPLPAVNKPASFPATTGPQDLQLSCATEKFPTLTVDGMCSTCARLESNEADVSYSRCTADADPALLGRQHDVQHCPVQRPGCWCVRGRTLRTIYPALNL